MMQNEAKNTVPLVALTVNQEKAVRLVLLGKLTEEEIAEALGLARSTVQRWKKLPAFTKRLDELCKQLRAEMGYGTIADQLERLQVRDARWKAHCRLREKRAARFSDPQHPLDPDCADELATGMYKKKVQRYYDKETRVLVAEVIEPVFDLGLYRALHDDELLTAKELGDIKTRQEISGPGGKPIPVQAEVRVVGYAIGGIDDALQALLELQAVGRLPTTIEECIELITELEAWEKAKREGKPVPPMSEPYIPALYDQREQED